MTTTSATRPAYRAFDVVVAAIERLSPSFVRVRFASDDLADLAWDGPDQRIKLVVPLPGSGVSSFPLHDPDWFGAWRVLPDDVRNPLRTYTIRAVDRSRCELVVDFAVHGDIGPASAWVGRALPGERLLVIAPDATSEGPRGGWEWRPGAATTVLVAGDETAVPAACAIVESLPPDASGAVFLEVPTADDVLPLAAPDGVRVSWLPRGSGVAHGELLLPAVREWTASVTGAVEAARGAVEDGDEDLLWDAPDAPDGDGLYAWVAAECGVVAALRRHLRGELGIDNSRVACMGYWKLGRAEG